MQTRNMILVVAILVVSVLGIGLVTAHGGFGMMDGSGMFGGNYMHDEMDGVLESGNYNDLEELRDEYNMPVMHWVDSVDDFEFAKEMHERFEDKMSFGLTGGCHG